MEHEIYGTFDVNMLGHILLAKHEGALLPQLADIIQIAGNKIVQANDAVPLADEIIAEVRPQKSGAPGNYRNFLVLW